MKLSNLYIKISMSYYIFSVVFMSNNAVLRDISRFSFFLLIPIFFFKKIKISKNIILVFLPFISFLILNNFWAVDKNYSIYRSIGIGYYLIGALIFYFLISNKVISKKFLISLLFISISIVFFSGFIEFFILNNFVRATGSIVDNANTFALNIIFISIILNEVTKNKKIHFLTHIYIIFSFIISGSRKSLIAISIYYIYIFIKNYSKNVSIKKIMFSLLMFLLFIIFVLYNYNILFDFIMNIESVSRFQDIIKGNYDFSYIARKNMIEIGLEKIKESVFFGYGNDNFRIYSYFNMYSHNNYIELLFSGGIFAIFSYYIIYIYILIKGMKVKPVRLYTIMFISLMMILETAYVAYHTPLIWFILLLLIYMLNEEKEHYKSNISP